MKGKIITVWNVNYANRTSWYNVQCYPTRIDCYQGTQLSTVRVTAL